MSERTGQRGSIKALRTGVFLMAALINGAASAAPGDLLFKVNSPEPQTGARFGETLGVVGSSIVVGEPSRRIGNMAFVGQAYLFDAQTGALRHTLEEPEPTTRSIFGNSITGGGGNAFIGGGTVIDRGRIYVFDEPTGSLQFKIDSPNGGETSFGSAIAYGDGSLFASASSFSLDLELTSVGRAYMFNAASGQLELALPNPEPKRADGFGFGDGLALFGNTAVVGALLDDLPDDNRPDGDNPGRVWVFDRASGAVKFTIENPNPETLSLDWFGFSVAGNEKMIVVGAQEDETSGVDGNGTVYVFDSNTGALKHTLFSPQLESNGEFGRSVAITPNGDVLVGAWGMSANGIESAGHVYLFDGSSGNLLLDVGNPEPESSKGFGFSVAAMDNKIVVGAPSANSFGLSATGVVYVIEGVPEPGTVVTASLGAIVAILLFRIRVKRVGNV